MPTFAMVLLFVMGLPIQRIETQYPDPGRVTRVETALNHLTVIELAEPVSLAAAGSPSFKIERRENKVFVQPLEQGASTNLFVWTASGRWTYELVPAISVETMHFAIDQQVAQVSQNPNTTAPEIESSDVAVFPSLAEEMLLFAKPIRTVGLKQDSKDVGVVVRDVYRKDDHIFVRYVIDNRSAQPYVTGQPAVFALDPASSEISVHAFRYSQVGPDIEKKIRSGRQTPIATVDCELPSEPVPAGEAVMGLLTVQLSQTSSDPAVLRIVFPAEGRKSISLTLVL